MSDHADMMAVLKHWTEIERLDLLCKLAAYPESEVIRTQYADWLTLHGGEIELKICERLRQGEELPLHETSLGKLRDGYSWLEVFGEDGNAGNTGNEVDPCPPDSDVDTSPPTRADIEVILAVSEGEHDEDSWEGVFLLKDGRFLLASGWCDYTGWD